MQQRDSLKGLPGVTVMVEGFRSAMEDAGFDRLTFQTDVELKLRMAGIKTTEDLDFPLLYLNVNAMHLEQNRRSAFGISLDLFQRVLLRSQLRSHPKKTFEDAQAMPATFATTWSNGSLGFGSVADARDSVRDLVDIFVNDWLAVNPQNGAG